MLFENRLNYEITGAGEKTVLLLHGWGGSTQSWLPVARDLAADFKVINIDFPGFGESPEPEESWTVTEYTELIYRFITSLGLDKIYIIAHSFGGRVALLLSSTHPELVEKQVLTGCAGIKPETSGSGFKLSSLYDNGLAHKLLGDKGVKKLQNAVRSHFGSADYKNASPVMREVLKNVLNQDLRCCLKDITASTLLIFGQYDTATPVWMGRELESGIRDAALIVFENATHFAYLEQYARFIAITGQFLRG